MTGTKAEDPSIGAEPRRTRIPPAACRCRPICVASRPAGFGCSLLARKDSALRATLRALRVRWPDSVVPMRRRPEASARSTPKSSTAKSSPSTTRRTAGPGFRCIATAYVGYVPAEALSADVKPATHRVRALGTFVYPTPDIKAPLLMLLSVNSLLAVSERERAFLPSRARRFVARRHVMALNRFELDYVDVAERLIGTPISGEAVRGLASIARGRSARARSRRYSVPAR